MPTALQSANITFKPVNVTGGRKYRGRGYLVRTTESVAQYGWKTAWTTTARKALTKKGLAKRPEFEAAFASGCRDAGLC